MDLTRNILDFYNDNPKNYWYLKKYFTDNSHIGIYNPYDENAIDSKPNGNSFMGSVDEHNTYKINSLGLRGEVYKDAEILAFGCSVTFGIGVPEEGRWTNLLSDRLGEKVMNLGNPGASIETICHNVIKYCMNNKMPKEIFCLMPDFFRNMVVVDKEFYKSKLDRGNIGKNDYLQLIFCNPRVMQHGNNVFMEITDKKYIEDATSPHQLILNAINNIYILESFCLLNNIKLYWTTSHKSSSLIMQELVKVKDFKLKNFSLFWVAEKTESPNVSMEQVCGENDESEFKNTIFWKQGTDYSIVDHKKILTSGHPGIHFQYHVAEFFHNLSR